MAANVMRPRALGVLVVVTMRVMMRPVVRVVGRVHVAVAHVDRRRTGPMVVVQVHAVMRHVIAVAMGRVRAGKRADAEGLAVHGASALTHPVALAHGACLSGDFVAWRVSCGLGHVSTPVSGFRLG